MKILLENSGYALKNIGDIAMLQAAVSRFRKNIPNSKIYVFTTSPERLKHYCPCVSHVDPRHQEGRQIWLEPWAILGGLHKLFPARLHVYLLLLEQKVRLYFPYFSRKIICFRRRRRGLSYREVEDFFIFMQSVDVVVAAGGGYVTDTFERHAGTALSTLGLASSMGKKTYMLGQGFGPIRSPWLVALCRLIIPRINLICIREERVGKPLLESLCPEHPAIITTGDDAIELAYDMRKAEIGNGIGVNLRVSSYSEVGSGVLNEVKEVLNRSAEAKSASLIPIPISGYSDESDSKAIAEIIGSKYIENQDILNNPEQVIQNVGECRVVVTGSYHAGVFALSQGIPVIGLSKSVYYSNKFFGLADQFGLACVVVDVGGIHFGDILESAINDMWEIAPKLKKPTLEMAAKQVRCGKDAYNLIFSALNEI